MGKYGRQHIGKTFNEGNLTVVDGGDHKAYIKVKCSICTGDFELFEEGIFDAKIGDLSKGNIPCGCSKKVLWSLKQQEVRIKRKIEAERLPIRFLGFGDIEKPISKNTSVKLYCEKENLPYEVSNIQSFLRGVGNFGKIYSVDERISLYNAENKNYRVWDSGKRIGSHSICGFYCKICESNGYESLFEIVSSSMFNGNIPCYCSKQSKSFTETHIMEIAKGKLHAQCLERVSVFGAYILNKCWQTVFLCDIHGVYTRAYSSLDKIGCHCVKCTPPRTGYDETKKGYIYLLKIQTQTKTVLGYGITNKLKRRITTHKRNLKSIGATITNMQVFEGSGTAVLAVENAIKSLHKTGLLDCEGFRRESISIDRKDEVLELCKKLKELDNVKETI